MASRSSKSSSKRTVVKTRPRFVRWAGRSRCAAPVRRKLLSLLGLFMFAVSSLDPGASASTRSALLVSASMSGSAAFSLTKTTALTAFAFSSTTPGRYVGFVISRTDAPGLVVSDIRVPQRFEQVIVLEGEAQSKSVVAETRAIGANAGAAPRGLRLPPGRYTVTILTTVPVTLRIPVSPVASARQLQAHQPASDLRKRDRQFVVDRWIGLCRCCSCLDAQVVKQRVDVVAERLVVLVDAGPTRGMPSASWPHQPG